MNVKIKKSHEFMVNEIREKEGRGRKIEITDSQIVHTALEEFYKNNYSDADSKTKDIFETGE